MLGNDAGVECDGLESGTDVDIDMDEVVRPIAVRVRRLEAADAAEVAADVLHDLGLEAAPQHADVRDREALVEMLYHPLLLMVVVRRLERQEGVCVLPPIIIAQGWDCHRVAPPVVHVLVHEEAAGTRSLMFLGILSFDACEL